MKSLLTMSDSELAAIEAGESFGVMPAIGISAAASVLAFGGMFLRYAPGDEVPVAGMDHWLGQFALATGLGLAMLLSAALVRSVIMKRLQWAVLISLAIHMGVCLTLNSLVVETPLMAMETGASDVPLREFSLPDYGGAESQDAASQEWERPTEIDVPESEQHQLDRQQTEPEMQAQPEQFESERQVQDAQVPDRREMQQELERERQLEIEKQMQTAESDAPEILEAPELQTQQSEQAQLQAREMNRAETQLQQLQRQQYEFDSRNDPQVSSTKIANRAEVTPQEIMRLEMLRQRREHAEARMSETSAENIEIAEANNAPRFNADSRRMEQSRQSQSSMPQRTQFNDSSFSSSQMQVRDSSAARSSNSQSMASNSSPTSGGASSMPRSSTTSGRSTSAANTSAQSVNVSSASGTSAPQFSANTAASNVSRGRASVPSGQAAGGGGAPSTRLSRSGVSALQFGSIGRSTGNRSGPQMGSAVASNASGRFSGSRGSGSSASAVGVRAGDVSVAGVSGGGGSSDQVLASGPSSASSSRGRGNSGELPSLSGRNGGTGSTGFRSSRSSNSGQGLISGNRGRDGLSDGLNGPSARLGGSVGSTSGSRSGTSRRSAGVALPSGILQAEETGALVITGPQAPSGGRSSSSALSGPRTGSVSRRSSGLPGLGRGPSSAASSSRRRSMVSGLGPSGLSARRSSSTNSRPKLSSRTEVASMFKRAVPGISPLPTERLSATFSMRTPEGRAEAVSKLGGSDASEAAVARGLEWLAEHQFAAGNWSIHEYNCKDHNCGGHGTYQADTAATGLALLSFLGAGHTHKSGEYQEVVQRALGFLLERQSKNGDLFGAKTEFCWLYSHGMASIALCEAYGMTKDPHLKQPAQKAINFIVAAQHPKFGGWRYRPQFESDTSVSGWQLMALKSAEIAGLNVPRSVYNGVDKWLDSVEKVDSPGRFAYHPTKPTTPSMSAEGLLMRQYLGAGRTDEQLLAGASFLKQRLPRLDSRDVYYWYYATQVMFHMQGEHWNAWNVALRDMLVESQDKGGAERGSWDPEAPTKDTWGRSGGRHYVTCMNLLMLEVYYRHLPLYLELNQ